MKGFTAKAGLGAALGAAASLLGGVDIWLLTLIGFTAADYITGLIKAVITKTLNSGAAFKGGLKKLLIYVIVGVAVALDQLLLPETPLLRGLAVGYYIAAEGLSVLENISECGVPFPKKLTDILLALRKSAETPQDESEDQKG
ncbi:MAG: phage holin family protein [Oscillospiraceae bacterium]|nr:phage holin family protein [Oscillospiraceae bacterium]